MPTFELVTSVCSSSFCIFLITSQARSTLCHLYYYYCCYPLRAIKIALNLIMINNNQGNAFIIPERFLFPHFTSAKRKRTLPAVLPYIVVLCCTLPTSPPVLGRPSYLSSSQSLFWFRCYGITIYHSTCKLVPTTQNKQCQKLPED